MAKRTIRAKAERDPVRNVPKRLHDIKGAPRDGTPKQIAVKTLKQLAPKLKIDPDLKQLRFDKEKKTVLGQHVLFQQCLEGTPISGAWVRVDIDRNGKVYNVLNDLVPQPKIEKAKRTETAGVATGVLSRAKPAALLSQAEAEKGAQAEAGRKAAGAEILKTELVYYPVNAVPVRAWKVIVQTMNEARNKNAIRDVFQRRLILPKPERKRRRK